MIAIYSFSAKQFLEEQRGISIKEIVSMDFFGENVIVHAMLKDTITKAAITHEDFQKIHNKVYLVEA